jgi:hypothetical protein
MNSIRRVTRAIALDIYTMMDPVGAAIADGALGGEEPWRGNNGVPPRGRSASADTSGLASSPPSASVRRLVSVPPTRPGPRPVPGLRRTRSGFAGRWRLATLAGVCVGVPIGVALTELAAAVLA